MVWMGDLSYTLSCFTFDDTFCDVWCTCIVDYLVLILYNFDNKHTFIVIHCHCHSFGLNLRICFPMMQSGFHWRFIAVLTKNPTSFVCVDQRWPQTLSAICRNMGVYDVFTAVATRANKSGFYHIASTNHTILIIYSNRQSNSRCGL